jgi:2-methylfumaryl-CoA hydratase
LTAQAMSTISGCNEQADTQSRGGTDVQSLGRNQHAETVLEFVRWVMVRKRDPASPAPDPAVPELLESVASEDLVVPPGLDLRGYDAVLAGSPHLWDDYRPGERIDHVDGMTIEDAEHQMATRLYQNTARVHFNRHAEKDGRFGRRIVYGGHVISLARALSFNGLANAFTIAAINGGTHTAPAFAGDTVYAWSEVLARDELPGRSDLGALRLRTVAAKDRPCADFPYRDSRGAYDPAVLLDLDYTVFMPRRG